MEEKELKEKFKKSVFEQDSAWEEFFRDKPCPKDDDEERQQMIEFTFWYNNVRKQTDAGKTPAEMGQRILEYGEDNYEDYENQLASEEVTGFIENGKFAEAIKECDYLLKFEPENFEVLLLKSEALQGLGKPKKAKLVLEKCIELDKENPVVRFYLAGNLIMEKKFNQALSEIEKALEKDEKNFDYLTMKAQILFLLKDPGYKAILKEIESIDKKRLQAFIDNHWISLDASVELEVGKALENANKYLFEKNIEKAAEELQKLKGLPLSSQTQWIVKGMEIENCFVKKEIKKAKELTKLLIEDFPDNPHAYYYMSEIEFFEGKTSAALETIEKGIAIAKEKNLNHFDYFFQKAKILKILGDNSFVEWEEKAKKVQEQNLRNLKKEFNALGLKHKEKDGFIKLRKQ